MRTGWAAALATIGFLCSAATAAPRAAEPPVSPRLERFQSEAEFRRYVEQVQRVLRAREQESRRSAGAQFAQASPAPGTATDAPPAICPPELPECKPDKFKADSIVV